MMWESKMPITPNGIEPIGCMYMSTPAARTIATGGTLEKCNGTVTEVTTSENMSVTTTGGGRITYTGAATIYMRIVVAYSLSVDQNNRDVAVGLGKNGTLIACSEITDYVTTANVQSSGCISCIVEFAQNDYIEFFVTSDTNGDDVTVEKMNFSVGG